MNPLTPEQEFNFQNSTHWHICKKALLPYDNRRVEYQSNAVHFKCRPTSYKSVYINKEIFENYKNATLCSICNLPLPQYGQERVRDHCHITGNFRGVAYSNCNLNLQVPNFMPIFFS